MPDTAPSKADALGSLASFAAETPSSAIPAETLGKTALILADSIGAIAGGAAEDDVRALTARHPGGGPALVIGTGETRPPGMAALLNGTAGTTLEMDEGNQFAKGHPGMHTIPAALAAAPRDIPGADLLAAICLGYDTGARVGIATALRPAMHPHGTWGTLCAAAAANRLRGADTGRMRHALSLASSLSLATSRRTMLDGGTVRNVFTGVAGQMGLLAADMVAAGYTGDRDGLAEVFGRVVSDSFDADALTDALGARWEVDRNYFKLHSCCRFNHAALDALAQLTDGGEIAPDQVARITVDTYALAAELDSAAPANVLAAKFSVPFAVATALVTGSTGVASFTADRVTDPAIRALAARVTVREDAAMTARLPDHRPARVTVEMADGRVLTAATETNRGDWADPYSEDEIYGKYLSLATRVWADPAARQIWDLCLALPEAPSAAPLFDALARAAA
ncbi:MAG: MmgE/PrpD family protein [Pseudomonadota bacterium]